MLISRYVYEEQRNTAVDITETRRKDKPQLQSKNETIPNKTKKKNKKFEKKKTTNGKLREEIVVVRQTPANLKTIFQNRYRER
jgi:hypothetical protein